MKKISVLGSTGTIGKNTLEVVRKSTGEFEVVALAAGRNLTELRGQIKEFHPKLVSVSSAEDAGLLATEFKGIDFFHGADGLEALSSLPEVDVVVVGIVGFAALLPTLKAAQSGKQIALANKEALVVAGPLVMREAKRCGARLIPVDSEHSSLFQLLEREVPENISTLVLTASGGPFWNRPDLPLEDVTPQMAIQHPKWKMGPKISVDSATLMNKGLEVIEAHQLFGVSADKIEVYVHPQSILHGAVWLKDNSMFAHLSQPDMKAPIAYALSYPSRMETPIRKLDLKDFSRLEFYPPDSNRFPLLDVARQALKSGPSFPVVLNAANEVAVESFLKGKILFTQIASVTTKALDRHQGCACDSLEAILSLDRETRSACLAHLN